jgi:hypothetical protein
MQAATPIDSPTTAIHNRALIDTPFAGATSQYGIAHESMAMMIVTPPQRRVSPG